MRYDDSWIPPWRPGLPQCVCRAGDECLSRPPHLIVAITAVDGFCVSCAARLGIRPGQVEAPETIQLSLEVSGA
jgi:hypothetical protein